ncbi:MAG: hypothetical protein WBX25_15185 [Rhodomicrobium sp.]
MILPVIPHERDPGVLTFDAPVDPSRLAFVSDPFVGDDFSGPQLQTYSARDGDQPGYRVYEGGGVHLLVQGRQRRSSIVDANLSNFCGSISYAGPMKLVARRVVRFRAN